MKKFLVFLVLSCGPKHKESIPVTNPVDVLLDVKNTYTRLGPSGWIYEDKCDSLLFSSLNAIARGETFNAEAALDENGMWHRRPSKDCQLQENGSTISRDMFLGLIYYCFVNKKLDTLEQIYSYGAKNNWIMGIETRKFDTRVVFTPIMISLLSQTIYRLGGKDHAERLIPRRPLSVEAGYQSHLSLLQIALEGEMEGRISDYQLTTVETIATTHMQHNPFPHVLLHKYTDGDQSVAINMMLQQYPHDRLPTGRDWCSGWANSDSDQENGRSVCKEDNPDINTTHSGGDFLFNARMILSKSSVSQ